MSSSRLTAVRLLLFAALCLTSVAAGGASACGAGDALAGNPAEAEVNRLLGILPALPVSELAAAPGQTTLTIAASITIDQLRDVTIDASPPALQQPGWEAPAHPATMLDTFAPGTAPYEAPGIKPFRFRHFTNEFNIGGWHNHALLEYASTHGFSITNLYALTIDDALAHLPAGTKVMNWSGAVNWDTWMPAHSLTEGRYDTLPARGELADTIISENTFVNARAADFANKMIDMEHSVLDPTTLHSQAWYPSGDTPANQQAFEDAYYGGFANTQIAPIVAARAAGWTNISLYGWQPVARTFFSAGTFVADPSTDWRWNRYGREVYAAADVINPSVYNFYWDNRNVAYVLANIDLNQRMIADEAVQKPVRPYFWNLLHGGGPDWRWWRGQAVRDEDMVAQAALSFFTGIDGEVLWGWSGTTDHTLPTIEVDADVVLEKALPTKDESDASVVFNRYDVLHVVSIAADEATVQVVDKSNPTLLVGAGKPVYTVQVADLQAAVRSGVASVDQFIEGMCMAFFFEEFLHRGELHSDVSSQQQFEQRLPIVRRVSWGQYHVIATYDPRFEEYPGGRTITIDDVDGVAGRSLVLPADGKVRFFLVHDAAR
ncbi:MAG: hypothetical protein AB7S36_11195 [Planctomycetota bacterium]